MKEIRNGKAQCRGKIKVKMRLVGKKSHPMLHYVYTLIST